MVLCAARIQSLPMIFIGDYPEQVLVTGVKTSDCPVCPASQSELDEDDPLDFRDVDAILESE
jgi:hypothetical protein